MCRLEAFAKIMQLPGFMQLTLTMHGAVFALCSRGLGVVQCAGQHAGQTCMFLIHHGCGPCGCSSPVCAPCRWGGVVRGVIREAHEDHCHALILFEVHACFALDWGTRSKAWQWSCMSLLCWHHWPILPAGCTHCVNMHLQGLRT
jgi:hypothetical protein